MPKQKIILFDNNDKTFYSEEIKLNNNDQLETKFNIYPKEDFTQYFDEDNNTLVYISEIDIKGKVEAANLKKLRRSATLNNIFNYQTKKPLDVMVLMPYLIIALLIFFK